MQVGCREAQLAPAFRAAFDASFDAIRPSQHAPREIHLAAASNSRILLELTRRPRNLTSGTSPATKPSLLTQPLQQLDVALAVVTKSEALAEIDFARVQAIHNHVVDEVFGALTLENSFVKRTTIVCSIPSTPKPSIF